MANETAAQDRVPFLQKFIYGMGAFTNNLMGGALGNMAIILNLGLGMNPAVIGFILGSARLTDAFTDPVMGYVSDQTKSRWGRRRPYIVLGAILSGLIYAFMWQIQPGQSQSFYFWYFILGTNLLYLGTTIFATPFIALGYEMSADYQERARIQGSANFIGQFAWVLLSYSWAFMEYKPFFADNVAGARTLAVIIGVVAIAVGILPGLFCREPFYKIARAEKEAAPLISGVSHKMAKFFKEFGYTIRNRQFLKLAGATFLVFNGFMLISGLGSYVMAFYVCMGDTSKGAMFSGHFGMALTICTFGAIAAATWMATRIGKKRAFIICESIAIAGYLLKWFLYKPGEPMLVLLSAPFLAFGLGGLFTTIGAMIADVCDEDELRNGARREGSFGAIYWWMIKLGMAAALAASGLLLNATGFDQALGAMQSERSLYLMRIFEIGLPILFYGLAIALISTYDLDHDKVLEIRKQLEKRRGQATA